MRQHSSSVKRTMVNCPQLTSLSFWQYRAGLFAVTGSGESVNLKGGAEGNVLYRSLSRFIREKATTTKMLSPP